MRSSGLATAITLLALSQSALADHTEPASAKKAKFTLVNGFERCDMRNTATQAGNMPACAPAVPTFENGGCAFSSTGSGKLTVALAGSPDAGNQDIKLSASAKGLNSFCESRQMCISLSFRVTTDDCPEGSCTTEDVDFLLEGSAPI